MRVERLWTAYADGSARCLEPLADRFGELCGPELAVPWADGRIDACRTALRSGDLEAKCIAPCLSALAAADRHDALVELFDGVDGLPWRIRKYVVQSLFALGRKGEAHRCAKAGLCDDPVAIARTCEELLFSCSLRDEAYRRYGLVANRTEPASAWFQAVMERYPTKSAVEVLGDLMALTPGKEASWFEVAFSAELFDEAMELARWGRCAPEDLVDAAEYVAQTHPDFAMQMGFAALQRMVAGYDEVNANGVIAAHALVLRTARALDATDSAVGQVQALVSGDSHGAWFVRKVLERRG
ncbi:MAG: hypothetical protein AAF411_15015 [Myxococcota bacterium]